MEGDREETRRVDYSSEYYKEIRGAVGRNLDSKGAIGTATGDDAGATNIENDNFS